MPVRAVIILLREEIRLLPQVCLFLSGVLRVSVLYQNFPRGRYIYTLIKTFVIALDRQFQKGSAEEDD